MGKKFIIELLDDCTSEFKGIIVFGLTPEGQISAEPIPVEDLPPYTAPDLEQVRKEAYEEGFKDGQYAARNGLVANYAQVQETIQVGDEVEMKCGVRPAIYMQGTKGSDEIYLLFNDGSCGVHSKSEIERKTGRHFPEIAAVLKKMREGQDE